MHYVAQRPEYHDLIVYETRVNALLLKYWMLVCRDLKSSGQNFFKKQFAFYASPSKRIASSFAH